MKRTLILSLGLLLLLGLPGATVAVSIGEEAVTLNSGENFTLLPVNSTQPYIIRENSALGALNAASEAGGFNYTVSEDLPPERGILVVTSIAGIERGIVNGMENSWKFQVNGEEISAGPARVRLNSSDSLVYSYGPGDHTLQDAAYTLNISVNVTEPDTTGNQTLENVTNQTGNMTLVAMINEDGNLITLARAINATNLTGMLSTGGPYTIFAPNDTAFEAYSNVTVEELTAVLQYHIVEGNYTAEQLMAMVQQNMTMPENLTGNQTQAQNMTQNQTGNMTGNTTTLQTLLGENLTVSLNQTTNQIMVNNASLVQPGINASNGIIHIIDRVLVPENMTPAEQSEPIGVPNASQQTEISGDSSSLTIINRTG